MPTPTEAEGHSAQAARLERYRYVLGQKAALNGRSFEFLSLYQTLGTALSTAIVGLFVSWRALGLQVQVALSSFILLAALLLLLSLYVIISLWAGILSWREYNKEERELKIELGLVDSRPARSSVWRWYETYMITFVVIFAAGAISAVALVVYPQLGQ